MQIIAKFVNCCQPDDIVSIAVASSFFVAATEGQVVTMSKELPSHFLSENSENAGSSNRFVDDVYIPGAKALKIELKKRYMYLIRIICIISGGFSYRPGGADRSPAPHLVVRWRPPRIQTRPSVWVARMNFSSFLNTNRQC